MNNKEERIIAGKSVFNLNLFKIKDEKSLEIKVCEEYIRILEEECNYNAKELKEKLEKTLEKIKDKKIKERESEKERYNIKLEDIIVYIIKDNNRFILANEKYKYLDRVIELLKEVKIVEYNYKNRAVVSFDNLKKSNLKYQILEKNTTREKSLKELEGIPENIKKINGKVFTNDFGCFIATCDENGKIKKYLTEIINKSRSGKSITYKVQDIKFENNYYIIRNKESKSFYTEVYKFENDTWYKVSYNNIVQYKEL
ncbi:hypothetical protein ACWTV9_09245 [Clostridioides difficile]